MSATSLWFRAEVRRRWLSLVVLGLLAGLTAGVALAAVDGVRRTSTVIDRLTAATEQPDVLVLPSRPSFPFWPAIRRLPEVRALGTFGVTNLCATDVGEPGQLCGFPNTDRSMGRDVNELRVVEGRSPDPDRPDEVAISTAARKQLHLRIGQWFTVQGMSREQVVKAFDTGEFGLPDGPKARVRVVGVVELALWERLLGSSGRDDDRTGVGLATSASFVERYPVGYAANALVSLRRGARDVPRFRRHVAEITNDPSIPVRNLADARARFDRTLAVEQTGLLIFAGAVVVAGFIVVGQALARSLQASSPSIGVIRSLGATRSQAVAVVVAPVLVVAAVSVLVAVAVAAVVSVRFPIGIARSLELDRGVHLDGVVLAAGLPALVAAVLGGAAFTAGRVVRGPTGPARRSRAGRVLSAIRLPLPAELGTRLALLPGRGPTAVPVRPALAGAVVGVLGIVSAFTFRAGVDHAESRPALAGTTWNTVANVGPNADLAPLRGVRGLRAAGYTERAGVDVGGETVSAWSYEPVVGHLKRVVTDGRLPESAEEVTLGWSTARRLHARVGDSLTLATQKVPTVRVRVVGIGFLPEQEGHSAYDQGLWVTPKAFSSMVGSDIDDREVLADLHGRGAQQALGKALGPSAGIGPAVTPAVMTNLSSLRSLPLALAAFLAVLAAGALAHTLASSVRRRRHDLAVLRALGMSGRQVRVVITSQATTVGLLGVVVGVPVGLLAGRAVWRWFAASAPLLYVGPFALVAVAVVVPAALFVANVIGAGPARAASRLRPGETLRTE